MNILDRIIQLLENAEKSALMETASFGFPNDRIEVKSVHLGGRDDTGRVGDVLHPTAYVRQITRLHHQSWIVSPIREARKLLQTHMELIRATEELRERLDSGELQEILSLAERLTDLVRAGRSVG